MAEEKNNLRSEVVQDILERPPHWIFLWGNTIILTLIMLFLILAWFIKYPDIISADAIITTRTPPEKEYAQVSGKIDTILVNDRQEVEVGETLAMINNTAELNDVLRLKSTLDTISIQNKNFNFPVDQIPMLSLGEISSSYALFEKDYIQYSLNKTLDPFLNQINSNRISEKELHFRLKSFQNQRNIERKKFELSKSEFFRYKTLYDKGVISLNEYELKQIAYLEDENQMKNFEISLSQLKQSINEASKISKETKINNQMEETRLFKNMIQSYTQLEEAVKLWELKYLLKSNTDGKLSFINVWTENQNIDEGDLLFTIVPVDNEKYLAKIKAPIRNSGEIKVGLNVNIKLLNFPETQYGMLQGKIINISAIPNDEGFYLVQASLDSPLTTSYDIQIPFINEMNGTAEIITEDLRLLERFFYQIRGLFVN